MSSASSSPHVLQSVSCFAAVLVSRLEKWWTVSSPATNNQQLQQQQPLLQIEGQCGTDFLTLRNKQTKPREKEKQHYKQHAAYANAGKMCLWIDKAYLCAKRI